MQASNRLQDWYTQQNHRTHAVLVGLVVGIIGGLIGLLLAVAGPVVTAGGVLGTLAALYILTDVSAALYGLMAVAKHFVRVT